VPGTPAAVTCTITNTRTSAPLILQKTWVNGALNDAAGLAIANPAPGTPAAAVSTASGAAGSETDTAHQAATTVLSGETVGLAEVLGAGNTGTYTSQLTCDQPGLTPTGDGRTGTYLVPATPLAVTCTITNTRTSAGLILQKTWVNGASGDTTLLSITGVAPDVSRDNTSTANGVVGPETDTGHQAIATVYSGQTLVLGEIFGSSNGGTYTVDLTCTDPARLSRQQNAESGTYTVPSEPSDVTCTFINARTSAALTLRKEWVDGAAGDLDRDRYRGVRDRHRQPGRRHDLLRRNGGPGRGLGHGQHRLVQLADRLQSRGRVHRGPRRAGRHVPGAGRPGRGDVHDHQHPRLDSVDPAEDLGERCAR
jgi:hypothetical protein